MAAHSVIDDFIHFADEDEFTHPNTKINEVASQHWKLLIVDDEPSVHDVTKLVLSDCKFEDRYLEFISAFSAAEAKEILKQHNDIALVLLDVVMEDDHSGLEIAEYIRSRLKNNTIRIVLRTGQPGQAPERDVITNYDINDYKAKTELTADKLFTVVYASIRAYRDLTALENNRKGLTHIINSSQDIFQLKNLMGFTQGVIEQLAELVDIKQKAGFYYGTALTHDQNDYKILAETGVSPHSENNNLPPEIIRQFCRAAESKTNIFEDDYFIGHFRTTQNSDHFLYLSGLEELSENDKQLINIFIRNASIAHDNLLLHQDLDETNREIVYMLGEAVETRSRETGNHVKRVAEISKLLALAYGLSEDEAEVIKMASPLHDVGKIGIPDSILNKPGRHTPEETAIMQTHALIGAEMLIKSQKKIMQAGAIIAAEHHEKWDGTGYPFKRSGDAIHIYGRITAVADVFDALGSKRCYKDAWPLENIIHLFKEERGKHFDPLLVDLLLENMDKILKIRDKYSDSF